MANVTVYVVTNWQNLPTKTTPVDASHLNHLENGVKAVTDFLNTINASSGLYLCQTPFTNTLKSKLDGIEAQANKYVLPKATTSALGGVKPDGTTITVDGNGVISAANKALSGLSDVNLTSLANAQILRYDSQSSKWINATLEIVDELSDLSDVDLTSLSDGQILVYDAENSKWVNTSVSFSSLAALSDVNISYPADGEVLKYNGTTNKWENGDGGGSSGGVKVYLDDYPVLGQRMLYGYRNSHYGIWNDRQFPPNFNAILFDMFIGVQKIFRGCVNQNTTVTFGENDELSVTFTYEGIIIISGTATEEVYVDTLNADIPLPIITSVKCGGYLIGAYAEFVQSIDEIYGSFELDLGLDGVSGYVVDSGGYFTGNKSYDIDPGVKITKTGYTEGQDISVTFSHNSNDWVRLIIPEGTYNNVHIFPQILYKK